MITSKLLRICIMPKPIDFNELFLHLQGPRLQKRLMTKFECKHYVSIKADFLWIFGFYVPFGLLLSIVR